MKNILLKFKEEFFYQLDKKPSWGAKAIKNLFIITLNNVLLNNTEFDKDDSK